MGEADKYGFAALMSAIFPGLGQIVKGEVWKGIGIIGAQILNIILMMLIIGFITYPIVWIWSVYDAYNNVPPQDMANDES